MGLSADTHNLNTRLLRFRSQPDSEDAFALASDLLRAERYGDARGVAVAAQSDDAPSARLLLIEGRAWYMEGDLVRAQAAVLRAVQVDPGSGEAYLWLGEVLLQRGDPDRASRALARAVALLPGDADAERLLHRAHQLAAGTRPATKPPAGDKPSAPVAPRVAAAPAPAAPPQAAQPVAPALARPAPPQERFRPAPPPPAVPVPSAPVSRPATTKQGPIPSLRLELRPLSKPPTPSASNVLLASAPPAAPEAARVAPPPPAAIGVPDAPWQGAPSAPESLAAALEVEPEEPLRERAFDDFSEGALESLEASSAGDVAAPEPLAAHAEPAASSAESTSVGEHPAPATSTTRPGVGSTPGTRSAPGTLSSPGTRSAPGTLDADSSAIDELDVEVESPDAEASHAPAHDPEWLASMSSSPGITEAPSAASSAERDELGWDEPVVSGEPEPVLSPVPTAVPDLPLGADADVPDDPDVLLERLREQGVFEPPAEDAAAADLAEEHAPAAWAEPHEVERSGQRLKWPMIIAWALTVLLLAGGYSGFQHWVSLRHADAARLLDQARSAAWDGNHAKLLEAERLLSLARDKNPQEPRIAQQAMLVHAQRLLENGARELSAVRAATARARQGGADAKQVRAIEALLTAYASPSEASKALEQAASAAGGDAELSYLVGRAAQRLGAGSAQEQLEAAAKASPQLLAASIALAELAYEQGRTADARALLDGVLQRRADHLRARLWQSYLSVDEQEIEAGLAAVEQIAPTARTGAPIDRLLASLARARLLQRKGEREAAAEAVNEALAAGASEPALLALLTREALRAGQLAAARQAASAAVSAAPAVHAYRQLLVRVLLARGEGEEATALIAELPSDDPSLPLLRARAALHTQDEAVQRTALEALEATGGDGIEARALALRLRGTLQPSVRVVREAERLSKEAPSDPEVLRTLGEVALAAGEQSLAVAALEKLVLAMPDEAAAHRMLGRARRMGADAAGAEASLRRALELAPSDLESQLALGSLLLDLGRFADADALYQQVAQHSPLAGRLGRAEALLGLEKLEEAKAQLGSIPEAQREGAVARQTAARVALAARKPQEAVNLLAPLVQGGSASALTFALYGDALHALDQVDTAAGAYERALELDTALPEALIGRAEVHLRAERPDDALGLLGEAKEALDRRLRGPEWHARLHAAYGHAYVQRDKKGDLDLAGAALERAVKLHGVPSEAFFWLGEADGGRRTPRAAAAFKRYLELEPNGHYAARAKRALGPLL